AAAGGPDRRCLPHRTALLLLHGDPQRRTHHYRRRRDRAGTALRKAMSISLQNCREMDSADPLARYRDAFALPEGIVYLDGNSLGALPKAAEQRVREVITRQWGSDLIKSWNVHDWIGAPARIGSKIARLIGAKPNEVLVADSTSINVFKALHAALRLRP